MHKGQESVCGKTLFCHLATSVICINMISCDFPKEILSLSVLPRYQLFTAHYTTWSINGQCGLLQSLILS